jgi:hypothetical protein
MRQNKVYGMLDTAPAVGVSGDDIIEMTRNKVCGEGQDPTTTMECDADQEDPAYEYIICT